MADTDQFAVMTGEKGHISLNCSGQNVPMQTAASSKDGKNPSSALVVPAKDDGKNADALVDSGDVGPAPPSN